MPLFQIASDRLSPVEQSNFQSERLLQRLIEGNLATVFNCRLVASEFSTGAQHAGRIDTLALSEDNNPVIIEYKKVESSELINQSLFYLAWLRDHRGDFEIAAQKALGATVSVDWSDIRVICIAPNYRKYDLYAVQMMGTNIELWTYRLFTNGALYLEEIQQKTSALNISRSSGANDTDIAAPAKEAESASPPEQYTFEDHLHGKSSAIHEISYSVQECILGLDPAIEEIPKKHYIAYRSSQNIVCMEILRHKVYLFLKLNPKELAGLPVIARDVSSIGHSGTGDLEITLSSLDDLEVAKPLIEMAYRKVGG